MGFHERYSEHSGFMNQLINTVGFHERYSEYSGFVNQLINTVELHERDSEYSGFVSELKNTLGFHERYSDYSGYMNQLLWPYLVESQNCLVQCGRQLSVPSIVTDLGDLRRGEKNDPQIPKVYHHDHCFPHEKKALRLHRCHFQIHRYLKSLETHRIQELYTQHL